MLGKLATRNEPLLHQLAQSWVACGGQTWFLADAHGNLLWPVKRPPGELSTTIQIGEEPLPPGWAVVPIRPDSHHVLGFVGGQAVEDEDYRPAAHLEPSAERRPEDSGGLVSVLETQAALLGHILAREEELVHMAAELMSAYDQLVAMYRISEATRSHLELDDILRTLLEEILQLTNAQQGFVAMKRDGELRCVTCQAAHGQAAYGRHHPQHEALMPLLYEAVRQRGEPLLCNAPSEAEAELKAALPVSGIKTDLHLTPGLLERCLAAPAVVGGEVAAILGLLNKPYDFTAGDQKLVAALADEAGGLIERDGLQAQLVAQERLRRELEIAAEIQTGLLPTELPSFPGLDVAASSRQATEVGGDFYTFVAQTGGPLAVVIGDVAGKGIPAALFVTVAQTILQQAIPRASGPQDMLRQLSASMYDELTRASLFITAFVAYYYPAQQQLAFANAGHSPVLYHDAGAGQTSLLEADGPPAGVLPEILSADHVVEPLRGDILVMMSDGFNEMANPAGDMFGIERLVRLLEQHAERSASEIQDRFFEAVTAFAQSAPQADDLTICVLKVV